MALEAGATTQRLGGACCHHPVPASPLTGAPTCRTWPLLLVAQPGYRLYVIGRCKKLKMLDFRKVKQKVRLIGGACVERRACCCGLRVHIGGAFVWLGAAGRHMLSTPQACLARPKPPPGLQEREEAERLYGAAPQQAPATFEPEEELAQVGP